jgi:hypothetical protein
MANSIANAPGAAPATLSASVGERAGVRCRSVPLNSQLLQQHSDTLAETPANPNGIPAFSPGLSGTRYPGSGVKIIFNPHGVASPFYKTAATLSG